MDPLGVGPLDGPLLFPTSVPVDVFGTWVLPAQNAPTASAILWAIAGLIFIWGTS